MSSCSRILLSGFIHITEPAPAASSVDSDYIYVHTKVMHLGFSQQMPVKGETHLLLNIMVLDSNRFFGMCANIAMLTFPIKWGVGVIGPYAAACKWDY